MKKIDDLDSAYKVADKVLNSSIETAVTELETKILDLKTAMNTADSTLKASINELREELDRVKFKLDSIDERADDKINVIKTDNAKTEKVYRIIIIVLFAIEVVLILLFATHLIKRKK